MIVIFTKFDDRDNEAFTALQDAGQGHVEARMSCQKHAENCFQVHVNNVYNTTYPPKDHIYLRGKIIIVSCDV